MPVGAFQEFLDRLSGPERFAYMLSVVITGGIAMGKSTVMEMLANLFPSAGRFDADGSVHELLTREDIRGRIVEAFGEGSLNRSGQIDRKFLRKQVFDSVHRRAELEDILHPQVRREFQKAVERSSEAGSAQFFADIPLYFESGHDYMADKVLTVGAPSVDQLKRLVGRPGIDETIARKIVAAQWPILEKMARADVCIWNAGTKILLQRQIESFSQWLKTKT